MEAVLLAKGVQRSIWSCEQHINPTANLQNISTRKTKLNDSLFIIWEAQQARWRRAKATRYGAALAHVLKAHHGAKPLRGNLGARKSSKSNHEDIVIQIGTDAATRGGMAESTRDRARGVGERTQRGTKPDLP
jgi:hypothetical protein